MTRITRREFMFGSVSALALASFLHPLRALASSIPDLILKDEAVRADILYGAAMNDIAFQPNSPLAQLFAQQCAIITPESQMKWAALRPGPESYDFTRADTVAHFAQTQHMALHGHCLVWHGALPNWFTAYANPGNAAELLTDHIHTVMGHFKGRMHSWDVVNEVMRQPSEQPENDVADDFRDTPWLKLLGPGYIETAFRCARESDHKAMLCWNENGVESEQLSHERKRQNWLRQLREHLKRGIPIDAIGLQSHLNCATETGGPQLRRFLDEVKNLGLKILITELDVGEKDIPGTPQQRDQIIGDLYYRYLDAVLSNDAVIAVLTWGISDQSSWLTHVALRKDRQPLRPLPFDAAFEPKYAAYAIAKAMRAHVK
jgi:endo-1,4-beta-xylanase